MVRNWDIIDNPWHRMSGVTCPLKLTTHIFPGVATGPGVGGGLKGHMYCKTWWIQQIHAHLLNGPQEFPIGSSSSDTHEEISYDVLCPVEAGKCQSNIPFFINVGYMVNEWQMSKQYPISVDVGYMVNKWLMCWVGWCIRSLVIASVWVPSVWLYLVLEFFLLYCSKCFTQNIAAA